MQGGATVTAEESAFGLLSGLQVKRATRKGATTFLAVFRETTDGGKDAELKAVRFDYEAYLSRKLNSAERNYPTGDREMLGIYYALQTWRCYLEGASFTVNSDNLNHTWFNKKKDLSRRQAKWMLWMESYYSGTEIEYKQGKNNLSDPLSCRPDLASFMSNVTYGAFLDLVCKSYKTDPMYLESPPMLTEHDGLWYTPGERLAIPRDTGLKQMILQELHDCPSAGHLGVTKNATTFCQPILVAAHDTHGAALRN
jgi:hypothetical protein